MARRGFRRRRRQRVWLPVLGTETHITGATAANDVAAQFDSGTVSGNTPLTFVHSLTWDFPAEQQIVNNAGFPSLADFEQSGYLLDSIIGKCFVAANIDDQHATSFRPLQVTAGFEVLRVDAGTGLPVATGTTIEEDYDPTLAFNIRDPWIWRRTWILEPQGNNAGVVFSDRQWPCSTAKYGSVSDGPHIETKSRRRVGPEERLWFILTARHYPANIDLTNASTFVEWMLDYRLIGRPMKMSNRRNASR